MQQQTNGSMIRYTLKCENDHSFESWFQSADAFDTLLTKGLTTCPSCGSAEITKTLMAPTVRPSRKAASAPAPVKADGASSQAMTTPTDPDVVAAVQKLREHVEANSDYVGASFAEEARAIHDGEKPERAIYGQANAEEARKLVEDGIPALPLPFIPRQKTN